MELNKLHQGLSYEQYAAEPGLRASELKHLMRSPAHLVAAKSKPQEYNEALEFGKLFHLAIENGERFMDMYTIEPEFTGKTKDGKDSTRSSAAKEAKSQWYKELKPGTVVVKNEWHEPLVGMLKAVSEHPKLRPLIKDGVRETSIWAEDPETGIIIKGRPDFISARGHIVDFKTTRDAHPDFFMNQIFSHKNHSPFYILAAAHYAHLARVTKMCKEDSFTIVCIEKEPPYGIMIYPLDIGCIGPGEQWRSELTKLYAKCVEEVRWPCYPTLSHRTVPPEWIQLPK